MLRKCVVLLILSALSVSASAETVNAFDRGWYRNNQGTIESVPTNLNYLVGIGVIVQGVLNGEYRNYFAFDLTPYAGQSFNSATLHLYNPAPGDLFGSPTIGGFFQRNPSLNSSLFETYQLREVSTDVTSLLAGTGGAAAYADLADGAVYGTYDASLADNGKFIDITLNSVGLNALNSAVGGLFVLGGDVSTLESGIGTQTIFGFSNDPSLAKTQLLLANSVPEPESYTLLLAGLLILGFAVRRRRELPAAP